MLRDNLVGLIEPMRSARELNPRALFTEQKKSSDDRPQDALKIPAPEGRNLTLTENAASPFHAEPRHGRNIIGVGQNRVDNDRVRRDIWQITTDIFPVDAAVCGAKNVSQVIYKA